MKFPRDRWIHELFFTGLAVAGAACSPYRSAPPDTAPRQIPPLASQPITDAAAAELAKEYRSADPAKAITGGELLGFVDTSGDAPKCSNGPCDPAWLKLAEHAGDFVAIVRRNGALEKVTEYNFKEVVGAIDTPDKAALRLGLEERYRPTTCGRFVQQKLSCAEGSVETGVPVRKVEGGFEVATYGERNVCEANQFGDAVALGVMLVSPTGELLPVDNALTKAAAADVVSQVDCRYPSRGRMHEGFVAGPREGCELEYYLCAAREESAAVVAFERLAVELEQHGAPAALVAAAQRSVDQERRHAALFMREATQLARALGLELGGREPSEAPRFEPRSLCAMLEENAEEGCANETYAALVATYQAEHAPTPRLRRLFAAIASDEREHAALAHRVHAWGVAQLDRDAAADLARKHRASCERMAASCGTPLGERMGEPPPSLAAMAFRHVVSELQRAA